MASENICKLAVLPSKNHQPTKPMRRGNPDAGRGAHRLDPVAGQVAQRAVKRSYGRRRQRKARVGRDADKRVDRRDPCSDALGGFAKSVQRDLGGPAFPQKHSTSRLTQISSLFPPSRPERGALHDRHGRWRDAVDAAASGAPMARDERRCSGRRSRVVLTPRRWRQVGDDASHNADDGGKKARSPGRARYKP
jgi:hypothetical protein